ncbi:YncE family protein [Paenibacillus sp. J22TS3]|uniref:YncE family protein n=1 Tax=Paenibacillus sp. J22TS3 TaxID=2807192 RepID=UPI001B22B02D|nr:hypothetical protein [Paenibacillus sp. J22TS3]GIP22088.1 hypothetical protein J22TS3_23630 [Paenibacillus sp. J22TS3]
MKNFAKVITILLLSVLTTTACASKDPDQGPVLDPDPVYDIYMSINGRLGLVQVTQIQKNNVETSPVQMWSKEGKGNLDTVALTSGNKIYGSLYDKVGGASDRRLVVYKEGKKLKEISLDKKGPQLIIPDTVHNKAYVLLMFGRGNGIVDGGLPVKVFDTNEDKEIGEIGIKGALDKYTLTDQSIYAAVVKARDLGFTDVPDNYILQIDRTSGVQKILTSFDYAPKGMATDGSYIYIVNMPLYAENFKESTLSIYDLKGKLVKDVSVDPGVRDIVLDEKGYAYIAHSDKDAYDDRAGDHITVYDTKQRKIMGKIDTLAPTELAIVDHYLFAINNWGISLSMFDLSTRKLIKTIPFDEGSFVSSLQIIKR